MKRTQLKTATYLMLLLALLFTFCADHAPASSGPAPDSDDLRRTMECDWAILNSEEPADPENYINDENDDLVKLAASLGNNPVRIYNWVYKNVYYPQVLLEKGGRTYYSHSRLGARGTYLNKSGNHWDQSSLLIALLRISKIPARYVKLAANDLAYVEAWMDQDNYHGKAGGTRKGWVPLMPWMKEVEFQEGLDLFKMDSLNLDPVPSDLDFNFDAYLSDVKYESALELYERQVQEYLADNYPGKSLKDVSFKEHLTDNTSAILPRSLPEKFNSGAAAKFSEVPDANRQYIRLYIKKADNTVLLDYTLYMPSVAGKKFALDWTYSRSRLTPVFKLDSQVVQTGAASVASGEYVKLSYQVFGQSLVTRPSRVAGTYIHMGFDPFSASQKTIEKAKQKLQTVDADRVLNPATHEEYLGLMGSILTETFLNRLHENSKRAARLFHGTQVWNLCPVFIYTKPHSDKNPIPTNAESKFYYHPQWNIDAQSSGTFYKWDTKTNRMVYINWDAPINKVYRRLYGFAASYDEGRIFEDWMDTPGASTIKGLMLANADVYGTGNKMLQLVEADIVSENTARIASFENLTVLPEYSNQVSPFEAYEGFHINALFRIPDRYTPQPGFTLHGSGVDGNYAVIVSGNTAEIMRGTRFDLNSINVTSLVDGTICNFKAYKGSSTSPAYSMNVTANKTPKKQPFNWKDINRIVITPVTDYTKGPMVLENLNYTRKEYIPLLDNQTERHLGWRSVLTIMNYLRAGNTVITPIQELNHDGLSGNVSIVYKTNGDLYSFGMDNGGAASPDTRADDNVASADSFTPSYSDTSAVWKAENTISAPDSTSGSTLKLYKKTTDKVGAATNAVGDPVDMVTGEFYTEEEPDIMIRSRGPDLSVIRKYKSRLVYNGPFGFGWTWNHAEYILPLEGGKLIYYDRERTAFEIGCKNNAYVYPPGSRFAIEKIPGGYILTKNQSREKLFFSGKGYLTRKEDRFGNALTYEYTNTQYPNRITRIKDGLGRALTLAYNTRGKVTGITDFTGRTTRYLYTGDDLTAFQGLDYEPALDNATQYEYLSNQGNEFNNHNMSKFILPGGDFLEIGYYKNDQVAFHTNAKGETFNFKFSRLNRYTEIWNEEGYYRKAFFNAANDVIRISNEDGTVEQMEYDEYGHHNKVSHTDGNGNTTLFQFYPDGTPAAARETFVKKRKLYKKTNALGHSRTYAYDDPGNLFAPSEILDPAGRITRFEYNPDGSLHRKIQAPGFRTDTDGLLVEESGAQGITTTYEYDDYGHVTKITDGLGNSETIAYGPDNISPAIRTDKNGNKSIFTYYQPGDHMPVGTLKTATVVVDGQHLTTAYEYNQRNQKTRVTDPLNQVKEYEYNLNGQLTATTLPNGAVTRHIYDIARDIAHGAKIIETTDPMGESEHYTHNAIGKLIARQDKNQNVTTYEYDPMGRISKETDPFKNAVTYAYDGNGNITAKTDQRGNTTTFAFDAANRLTEENIPCNSSETGTCSIKKEYTYYPDGKLKFKTTRMSDPDHEDIVVFYEYDALGNLYRQTDGHGSPSASVTEYRHDVMGRLVKTIYPLGNYGKTAYDPNGNKLAVRFFDRAGLLLEETAYQYDERNLRITTTDPLGQVTAVSYDALGRQETIIDALGSQTRFEYDQAGNLIRTTDALGRITRHFYDLNSNPVKTINPLGETTVFHYDPNGNRTAVIHPDQSETRFFYDALNRKTGEQDELGNQQLFEYDQASNLISQTDAGGFMTSFEFDAANRMVKQTDALDYSRTTRYDEAGRILRITDARGVTTQNQYDVLGNLIKETRASGTPDAAVTRHVYDENNRKIQTIRELTEPTGTRDLITEFRYDDRDLLTALIKGRHTAAPETTAYAYDAKRQLVKTTDPRGNTTTTAYDPLGRKTTQTLPDGLSAYTWEYDDMGNLTLETLPEGETLIQNYDALDRLALVIKGQDTRHLDYDNRGRLIREVNFNNNTTLYEYDPAGRLLTQTHASGTADEATTTYTYDKNGNILTITNARGKTVSYTYNELSQRTRATDSDQTYKEFTFDATGALASVRRQDGTTVRYDRDNLGHKTRVLVNGSLRQLFKYDALSRMVSATDINEAAEPHTVTFTYTDLDRPATETQGTYTLAKQHDANGNTTKVTYPSGKIVDKAYDANNMLHTVHYQDTLAATAFYDKNSRPVYTLYGNNTELSLAYDTDRGRENYRSVTTPSVNPLLSVTNTVYDGQSNITDRTGTFNGVSKDESLAYDPLDRLTSF
ncbi:MAG: DUF6531 domain-containing protein, partial [Desulfobacterales bacterium]|nr:DUF6531 domain-containing protein [Desulfobacterales bacterium]